MSHASQLKAPISFSEMVAQNQDPVPELKQIPEPAPSEAAPKRPTKEKPPADKKPAAKKPKKQAEDTGSKVMKGFYIDPKDYKRIKDTCYFEDTPMSGFISCAAMDSLDHTFECSDASCAAVFTLRSSAFQKPPKPNCCPVCGCSRVTKKEELVSHA